MRGRKVGQAIFFVACQLTSFFVAHALLCAASSSLDALDSGRGKGIEMSLDAARQSACATVLLQVSRSAKKEVG